MMEDLAKRVEELEGHLRMLLAERLELESPRKR